MKERNHENPFKTKEILHKPPLKFFVSLVVFLTFWLLLLFFWFPSTTPVSVTLDSSHDDQTQYSKALQEDVFLAAAAKSDPTPVFCKENYRVYVYDLPAKFNVGLLKECRLLNMYTDMCPHVANAGLGQPLGFQDGLGGRGNWFFTHQFLAEMIFHARLEKHPCRTRDPNQATLFYLPFYGGLHASSKFGDVLALEFSQFVMNNNSGTWWWKKHQGRNHFIVLGRTVWDFLRSCSTDSQDDTFGSSCLLKLFPLVHNMSVLTVERNPWEGSNQHGIPYPSYFHPSSSDQLLTWQRKMIEVQRPHLFSFVGAPRSGVEKAAVRGDIIRQCQESSRCNLLKCGPGASKCHEPEEVMKVMMASEFCLQAPGDSFTRRSTFDAMMVGCIPVFFSPHTAYSQYEWYLPAERESYSVLIETEEEKKRIEEVLLRIPRERVERMRRQVIGLISKITYFHPNATGGLLMPLTLLLLRCLLFFPLPLSSCAAAARLRGRRPPPR
ncbi:hypothetical protein NMG60_11021681 [Bertholletia excelsa]